MKRWLPFRKSSPTVAVLRLSGTISPGRTGSLNDATLAPLIEKAVSRGKPTALALSINSPGGSPAQSSLIAARIRRLAHEKDIKVYAFAEDVAASGGYWLACAGDEIWVDPNSLLGSIGVISAGFGFQDFIARHGVERRVHTSGRSKGMLDPFRPEDPDDVQRLAAWQTQIHDTFIEYVRQRRGARLVEDEELFTGNVWIGARAVEKGLADGIGHLVPKMKEVFGDKVKFRTYGRRKGLLSRLGAQVAGEALAAVEDRAGFARYGL